MSLFQNLRHGLDAYTTDTVCLTLTYNKQTAACGYQFLSPKLSPVIGDALNKFLDLWFDYDHQIRTGLLEIKQTSLLLNGYQITLDDLYTKEQQDTLKGCLNINSYLIPFKYLGIEQLRFNYSGGGDEGSYEFEEEDNEPINFLEEKFWKNYNAEIDKEDLINLELLVDLITGSFDGDLYRDGAVLIDLVKTEISIEEDYGEQSTSICLNSTDQFERTACLSRRDLSYLQRPLSEIIDINYLVLHEGLVYTATKFAIMQVILQESNLTENAIATSYSPGVSVLTKQRQVNNLGFSKIEIPDIKFSARAALDLAVLSDTSDQLVILEVCNQEINTINKIIKVPMLVRSDVAPPELTERVPRWFKNQVEGICNGDIASLVLLVAEMDAIKAQLLIS